MMEILDRLFGPLARLLVARGILFPDLAERLKAHYVKAAEDLAGAGAGAGAGTGTGTGTSTGTGTGPGRRVTDSRLSVMTGLQRRDISRLKGFRARPERPNHLVRLVALWQTEAPWAEAGKPRALPKNGPAPSFEALAQQVRRDVHARSMLDALLASGTVAHDAEAGTVRLVQGSYQPLAGSEEQIAYLAANLGDHASAATENVLGRRPAHFERAVHYGGLTGPQVAELAAAHAEGQMALFQALSQRAAAMRAETAGRGGMRFRAGAYFYDRDGEWE